MQGVRVVSPNAARSQRVSKAALRGAGGIVVAQNHGAAQIGAAVLRRGGNAVDAAVATSFAVGVLEPWMSGIGGVGGLVLRQADGTALAIDAGARAPGGLRVEDFRQVAGSDADLFGWPNVEGQRNTTGAAAVGVPALVAGLAQAHRQCGSLPWRDLLAPSVELARDGVFVDPHTTWHIATEMARLNSDPGSRAWFLPNGVPPTTPMAVTGRTVRLPAPTLAATLARIAEQGAEVLYQGELARRLAADVRAAGGYLSEDDLRQCAPRAGATLRATYRGGVLHALPELNGAITVAMAMRACEAAYRPGGPAPDADTLLAYADALLTAWQHRFERLGDGGDRALPSCTTHISVVDRAGNTVALTQTLLSTFGACFVSPSTGILLNNGINWFDPRPGRPNSLMPGARALANYAPAIFETDDDVIAIGGSGGRKIIPAVFQTLARLRDFGGELADAIAAPRLDVSAPPLVVADERLPDAVVAALAARHRLVLAPRQGVPSHFALLGAVRRRSGINEGACDPYHPWADAVGEDEPAD